MGILSKLFGKTKNKAQYQQPEHTVIVRFLYGIDGLEPLHQLEDELEKLIRKADVGEYDGHEIATDYSDGFIYMYGPNAEILFKTVQPTLKQKDFMYGAIAKLRFGPSEDGVKEIEIKINEYGG